MLSEFPIYSTAAAVLRLWEGWQDSALKRLRTSKYPTGLDAEGQRAWITQTFAGEERALLLRVHEITHRVVPGIEDIDSSLPNDEPRTRQLAKKYDLTTLDADGRVRLTERGRAFTSEDEELFGEIDESEGVREVLKIVEGHDGVRIAEITQLLTKRGFSDANPHKVGHRLRNLRARLLVDLDGGVYRATAQIALAAPRNGIPSDRERSNGSSAQTGGWDLKPGDEIVRTELHDRFGGSRQGGIAPSAKSANVLVFSDAASGHRHGYFDRWDGGAFIYCGEGQEGDQELWKGNGAILRHREDARALRLFQGARGTVRYIGEFEIDTDAPYVWEPAPSTSGQQRKVIMFRLRPVEATAASDDPAPSTNGEPYEEEDEDVATEARQEFRVDPAAVDRALRGHRRTQNLLARWALTRGFDPLKPAKDGPAFDVAWQQDDVFVVAEVKSLRGGFAEAGQLRLGLGQVLDYADQLLGKGMNVQPVLAVERAPELRWTQVCERNGVILVWPETFDRLASIR